MHIILPSFPRKDGDTFYKCSALSGWKVKALKRHVHVHRHQQSWSVKCVLFLSVGEVEIEKTVQLKKRRNCFSKILPRKQSYLQISSLLLTSPGWTDEVCSEFNTSQLRVNLALNYFIPVKWSRTVETAEGSKLHIRNFEWWNTLGSKNCVTVDHADANWVVLIFSCCKVPKKENSRSRERCADDSLRGTRHILFFFFVFVFLLSLNGVKV